MCPAQETGTEIKHSQGGSQKPVCLPNHRELYFENSGISVQGSKKLSFLQGHKCHMCKIFSLPFSVVL